MRKNDRNGNSRARHCQKLKKAHVLQTLQRLVFSLAYHQKSYHNKPAFSNEIASSSDFTASSSKKFIRYRKTPRTALFLIIKESIRGNYSAYSIQKTLHAEEIQLLALRVALEAVEVDHIGIGGAVGIGGVYLKILLLPHRYLNAVLVNTAQLGDVVKAPHELLGSEVGRMAFLIGLHRVWRVKDKPVAV